MKKKLKGMTILILIISVIVIIALILLIDPVRNWVSKKTGVAADKIKFVAATVAGTGVGLILMSFGITALAAFTPLGIALVVIGLAMVVYSMWPVFAPADSPTDGK